MKTGNENGYKKERSTPLLGWPAVINQKEYKRKKQKRKADALIKLVGSNVVESEVVGSEVAGSEIEKDTKDATERGSKEVSTS